MNEMSPRRFNARLGVALFVVYLVLYLGFVLINAFAADLMEVTVLGGLNLAILYGFGLILVAFVLAMIYGVSCRRDDVPAGGATPPAESHTNESHVGDAQPEVGR